MTDYLLLPDRTIEGPTRVTATVRPQRVAFLVDPAASESALAAIESACLTWGGIHDFLIPCTPGGRPDPVWISILDKYDPDVLLDLVGVEETFREEQQEGTRNRYLERWERSAETMEIVGATVFASLRRWKRTRTTNTHRYAINLHPLAGEPLALPLAFRWGHLHPRPMDPNLILTQSYQSGAIRDFVDLNELNPQELHQADLQSLAVSTPPLVHHLLRQPLPAGNGSLITLPALTRIGLPPCKEPGYYIEAPPHPEHEQSEEAFFRKIAVVGLPSSIDDLCLAWNLRAQRANHQFFPQWINPEWIQQHETLQSLHWGLNWERQGVFNDEASRTLHLVSASLTVAELRELAPQLDVPLAFHDRQSLDCFFSRDFRIGLDSIVVANFLHGRADIPIPNYSELGDWDFWERLGSAYEIDGYEPPPLARSHMPWHGPIARLANDGTAGFIDIPLTAPSSLWTLFAGSAWDIAHAAAKQVGYSFAISEKGRRALAVMRLLHDEFGLRLIASSRVFSLIETMSQTVRRQAVQQAVRQGLDRLNIAALQAQDEEDLTSAIWADVTHGGQFDRQHLTWDQVRNTIGVDIPRDQFEQVLEWLIEHRILFQGYQFQCPSCGINRWNSINHLSDVQVCEGCGDTSRKPITTNQLNWRYRLNETLAQSVEQGVLPHLLAANRMLAWRVDQRGPLFGLLPGVQLSPLEPGGPAEIEVDLFGIKGNRIVVGECKRGGDRITETVADRFAALGHKLNCSRIVFATANTFADDLPVLERASQQSAPTEVELWDNTHLFDRLPYGPDVTPAAYLTEILTLR